MNNKNVGQSSIEAVPTSEIPTTVDQKTNENPKNIKDLDMNTNIGNGNCGSQVVYMAKPNVPMFYIDNFYVGTVLDIRLHEDGKNDYIVLEDVAKCQIVTYEYGKNMIFTTSTSNQDTIGWVDANEVFLFRDEDYDFVMDTLARLGITKVSFYAHKGSISTSQYFSELMNYKDREDIYCWGDAEVSRIFDKYGAI